MPEQAAPRRRGPAAQELTYQRRVLRRIALGEPLDRTLAGLCRHVERLSPNANCTVLLLDRPAGVLRHGACPSLPRAYAELIDGLPVAEGAAACGTAAARGEVVIVEDILSDPLTAAFAEIGRQFGLASVWSQPLRQADGEVLGTVAVYPANVTGRLDRRCAPLPMLAIWPRWRSSAAACMLHCRWPPTTIR